MTRLSKGKTAMDLEEMMSGAGARFPVIYDEGNTVWRNYQVGGIPDLAVVKGGEVVFRGHPKTFTEDALEEMLAAN